MALNESSLHRSSVPFTRQPLTVISGIPIFIEPDRYTRNYDRIARDHLASLDLSGTNPFMADEAWTALDDSSAAVLADILKPGDVILDAGVGLGRILSRFPQYERHGVDIALEYLDRTIHHGIHVALAKLEALPYPDGSFDVVTTTDVLEHVMKFDDVTAEIVRVLKPGGHLVLRVPLEEDMKVYYDYNQYDFVHLRRFDLWSLRLHFERILNLTFVKDQPVLPLYRGLNTSLLRPVKDGNAVREILAELPPELNGAEEFRQFTHLTQAAFESFMNAIATAYPDTFKKLIKEIANCLELNVVFQKPSSRQAPLPLG